MIPHSEIEKGSDGKLEDNGLERTMGMFSGMLLCVGMIVGSGIFSTPALILEKVGSPGMAILIWVIGGLVSFAGTFAYLELGTMRPRSGGEKEYLDYAFQRPKALLAFLFSLSMIFLIRTGYCAADSIVFGTYLLYAGYGPRADIQDGFVKDHFSSIERGLAVFAIVLVTLVQALSVKWAIRIQDTLTIVKIVVLIVVTITGVVAVCGAFKDLPENHNFSNPFQGTSADPTSYASALFKIFFTYDGWNNLNYSIDELIDPIKNLPRAAIGGISITTTLYVLANVAYFAVVPKEMIGESASVLAADFFRITFGPKTQAVIPVFIALSTLGAVFCMSFSASRVIYEVAREGYLPFSNFLAVPSRFKTPLNASLLHCAITLLFILGPPSGEAYAFLIDLSSYPTWVFYGLSVIGLLKLRFTEPDTERPFRCWTVLSVFFVLVAIFLSVFPFIPPTVHSGSIPYWLAPLCGLLFIVISVPCWYIQVVVRKSLEHSMKHMEMMGQDEKASW